MLIQQQFFDATDVFSSCFVFASAGSGKTKILVDRYVKSLFFGIHPQEILCLTFTNAAVFEMQSRISIILEKLYLNENNYTEKYLQEILKIQDVTENDITKGESLFFEFQDNLSNLKIVTIHSFCQSLLQKFPMESGIKPNFEIMDENEAVILINTAKQNALKKMPEELINTVASIMSGYSFEDFINRIYSASSQFANFFSVNNNIKEYEDRLSRIFNGKQKKEFTIEQKKAMCDIFATEDLEGALLTKTGSIRKKLPCTQENSEIVHELAEIIYENSVNSKKRNVVKKTVSFLEVAKFVFDEYQSLKAEQNVLDFADVLQKTEYLLTKSCAKEFVISRICTQIKSILIDEAQDLSSLQWKLITLFSEEIFEDAHSKSTIFVVGDIKQSIYRFQDANHKLFVQFYKYCSKTLPALNKPIKTVYLNMCYRSLPNILKAVDSVFDGEVGRFAFEEDNIDYKKHIPYRQDHEGIVELISLDEENPVNQIADTFENLINSKIVVPSTGKEIQASDVMILTRSRSEISESLINELTKRNIKIAPPDRIFLAKELLVLDILALIDICMDKSNDYSLACILKSPHIFEEPLSNDDLFYICNNRALNVFDNLQVLHPVKFYYINEIISHYKENNLVEFLYYISILVVRVFNQKDRGILNALMNEAIKYSSKKSSNIGEFLAYVRESEIKISQQQESSDGVKVSTIHGAKGLEAPVIFLLDFELSADKAKVKFIWSEQNLKSLKDSLFFIKPSKSDSFEEAAEFIEEEYIEEDKELLRLLYVAMTRPRDILYIFGSDNNKGAFNLIKSKMQSKSSI